MRRNRIKTLVLVAIGLTILVYFAQMLDISHPKVQRNKLTDQDATVNNRELIPSAPRNEDQQSQEKKIPDEKTISLDDELRLVIDDAKPFDDRMEKIASIRSHRIKSACMSNHLDNRTISSSADLGENSNILVSDKYKVIFCSTGDANSESWRRLLLDRDGDGNDENPGNLRPLFTYRDESISYRLKFYYKFMVVQDPLVRLISAYKSWLIPHPNPEETDRATAKEMLDLSHKIRVEFDPESFYNREPNATNYARLPDVVAHVINETRGLRRLHPLWERYHALCQPCSLRYDYIMRPETVLDDARYVIARFHNPGEKHYYTGHMESSDAESIRELLDALTPEVIEKIYEVYRSDYELLGYNRLWE